MGGRARGAVGFGGPPDGTPPIGVERFWSGPFLWFYLYFGAAVGLFAAVLAGGRAASLVRWSILGSALILFTTYFQVQVSVAINDWYGPFYDMVQAALGASTPGDDHRVLRPARAFLEIALVVVAIAALTWFFVSHYSSAGGRR